MQKISEEELKRILEMRAGVERLDLSQCSFENMDLSGWNLQNINFDDCDFKGMTFDRADLFGITAKNALFGELILLDRSKKKTSLSGCNLQNAILESADFRGCDLSNADIRGEDVYSDAFYQADLTGIHADETTKHFWMACPEKRAFLGWKVCYGRRIVLLLIPEDARRVSGTREEIRCEKAKVLTIDSIDGKENYTEAHSYVDENFYYRVGQMVYAENFNPDRFVDSGGGIHVWLSREEAIAYLG